MATRLSLIGYGEAGRTFARAGLWGEACRVFDLKPFDALYSQDGLTGCARLGDAIDQSGQIISLVSADQSLVVAREASAFIAKGALYFDMNSVAPATKQAAAKLIEAAGGLYVDVAIMAPVDPQRLDVPLLISGPHAHAGHDALLALGFARIALVGDEIGRASTIKMLRSVMFKGVEALTAECLMACAKAGVVSEVMGSFGNDWASGADYRLDRMMVHGTRRSAEMVEVVKTLEDLGVDAHMTIGTAARQAQIGGLKIDVPPQGLELKLERLATL